MSNKSMPAALVAAMMLLAACGSPQGGETTTSTTDDAGSVTTAAPPTTTTPPTTTSSAPTTTDVPAEGDATSLFASLGEADEVASARVEGSIEMTGLDPAASGISDGVINFSSAFDAATGDSSFVMDMSSMMGDIAGQSDDPFSELALGMMGNMEFRQVGDTVYLKYPFFTSLFGAETEWVSMPAEEGEEFASGFDTMPTDPADLIDSFDDSGATVETVGTEEVNGVLATHYRVSLDTTQMELTPEEEAELAESGIGAGGTIPMEIWVSDAGHMVRMIMEIDGAGIDAPADKSFESMILRFDLFEINGNVVIEPPPTSDVTALEDLEGEFGFDG